MFKPNPTHGLTEQNVVQIMAMSGLGLWNVQAFRALHFIETAPFASAKINIWLEVSSYWDVDRPTWLS